MEIKDPLLLSRTGEQPAEPTQEAIEAPYGIHWYGPFPATGEASLEVHVRPFGPFDDSDEVENTVSAHSYLVFNPGNGSPPQHFSGRYELDPTFSNPLPLVHETGTFAGGSYELSEKNMEAPRYTNEIWSGSVEDGAHLKSILEAEGAAINAEDMTYLLVDQNCHYVTERLLSELNERGYEIDVADAVPDTPLGEEVFIPGYGDGEFWGGLPEQFDQFLGREQSDDAVQGTVPEELGPGVGTLDPGALLSPTDDLAMPEISLGEGDAFGEHGPSPSEQVFEDMLQLDTAAPLMESAPTDWSEEDALLPQDVLDRSFGSDSQGHDQNAEDPPEPWEGLSPVDAFAAHMAFEAWDNDIARDAQYDADHAASLASETDDAPTIEPADLSPDITNGASTQISDNGAGSTSVGSETVAPIATSSASTSSAATDAVGAE
ncbi:hypothetical protein [Puniceibacterium sp. IMCC21224]|uniref:hypothetical protein n=1 Tax=Puniceibacterium sp. IMCC21224 TaxID=1618204 RepID=UPI00064D845D|nr:hypothetical protein [Puniceibacterium sp. IMCC21224]KMK66003.1 hypothetical protein IMCC21224_11848 [Puniceibacterium sp. IMCC21224]